MSHIRACAFLISLMPSFNAYSKPTVIGNAEFCAISPTEIHCVDHNMNQCLRTLSLLRDGVGCVKNPRYK